VETKAEVSVSEQERMRGNEFGSEAEGAPMLRGLTTVGFWADDLTAAKEWYTDLLGIEPYFVRPVTGPPAYIEFRLGDYQHELGIQDSSYAPEGAASDPGGAVVYWHVDDVAATFERLQAMGAKEYLPITPRGEEGFVTAAVVDPFGNVLGIMYNPHYLEVLGSTGKA
jgi:predicted enzyme related to lactoylglutathione lyase